MGRTPSTSKSNPSVRYLEMIAMLGLGLVTLPIYALGAAAVWLLVARDVVDGAQFIGLVIVFWALEPLITMPILWSREHRRSSPSFRRFATVAGQVGGSMLAWWLVGGFTARAALAGIVAGVVYACSSWIHRLIGARHRPSDPAEREAENEKAIKTLMMPDAKRNGDG